MQAGAAHGPSPRLPRVVSGSSYARVLKIPPAPVPTLKDFAEHDFLPFIESRFKNKPKTLEYYKNGIKNLTGFAPLANSTLDLITSGKIGAFVTKRREAGLQVASINRQLEVLRRMQKLATEWGEVNRALPKVEMLPGENHRDRVLTAEEEERYLEGTAAVGEAIQQAYQSALEGIRATMRGQPPTEPADPFLLRDVTTVLLDCGLRPDECFRLRWEHVRDGALHVPFGKTENARRTIPLTPRLMALMEMRRPVANSEWVFPAPTRSEHMEKSTLKKQHPKAYRIGKVAAFSLYTFRHTCLTRWAEYMDPFTLAYLAGTAISPRRAVTLIRRRKRCGLPWNAHEVHGVGTVLGTVTKKRLQAKRLQPPELIENTRDKWSGRVDSNHRPPGPEPGALARLSHAPYSPL